MRNIKIPILLAVAVAATRVPFTSKYLFNMDSVQFALGARNFDVALHQPHPPGYFLYVMIGRFLLFFINDENTAFIAVSIIFSAFAVIAVFFLARELFDEEAGLAAAMVAITSPILWLHGEVALSYAPEAFMSVFFAYVCWRMQKGEPGLYWAAAISLAVAGGIRQNTMVFLFPLWVYSIRRLGARRIAASLLVFALAMGSWFLPMLYMAGGYARYDAALKAQWLEAAWRGIHLHWIAFNGQYTALFVLAGVGAAIAPIAAGTYFGLGDVMKRPGREKAAFLTIWLLPSLLFYLIIFTYPAAPGYSLIYLVGFFVISGKALTSLPYAISGNAARNRRFKIAAVSIVAAANAYIFVFMPTPFSAGIIKAHDRLVRHYVEAVKANFSPADTEIIGSNRFFFNFRHAMYYLPEFRSYDTTVHAAPGEPHILWGTGRETKTSKVVELPHDVKYYIDFVNYSVSDIPGLPDGAKYISLPDDEILVYYDRIVSLRNVARVAPLLKKG